jgi:hypothetical protein
VRGVTFFRKHPGEVGDAQALNLSNAGLRAGSGAARRSLSVLFSSIHLIATNPFTPGPCRIDPSFVIPDMDGRVPPR